jgi:hypothetical protein
MDGTKIALIVCFGLSALGVGSDLWLRDQFTKATKNERAAISLLTQIEVAKLDVEVLEKEKSRDKLLEGKGSNRYREFFEKTATTDSKMDKYPAVGTPQSSEDKAKGFIDTYFELKWGSGRTAERYARDKIASFMWHVENKTSLLRVSYIKLQTDPKSRDDLWEPIIGVTERRPLVISDSVGS